MASSAIAGHLRPAELAWLLPPRVERWGAVTSRADRAKRMLDVAVCLLLLPCVGLILLLCAIAIRLESDGPLLEYEQCTGRGGRAFRRYRLRTVRPDEGSARRNPAGRATAGRAELELVRGVTSTRVGHLLRRTRLAGLPQLFNVLRGEMSLVGPRPTCHAIGTTRLWHTARFDVRPGVVSAAQVWGRGPLESDECLRLDIAYSRSRTIALDLQILLEAIGIVVRSARYLIKRALDIVGSGLLIVLSAPVMLAVAVAIRRTSPGPILFRQARIGKNGQPFDILKFRTMRVDAEAVLVANPALYRAYLENDFKLPLDSDPRITPLGRWLRRTSLDELPQLVNVLRGEMSLVGPRPVVPAELAQYQDRVATFLSVLPGVTGAWQVSGRSCIRYPERCEIELEYIQSWSLTHDIVILVRTVGCTLSGRGAT